MITDSNTRIQQTPDFRDPGRKERVGREEVTIAVIIPGIAGS